MSIPLSSYDKLPAVGAPIKILTHLQVREDAHVLFGFMTHAERDLFRLLVTHVSGIGPKTAQKLIAKYDSLENTLDHAAELARTPPQPLDPSAAGAIVRKPASRMSERSASSSGFGVVSSFSP